MLSTASTAEDAFAKVMKAKFRLVPVRYQINKPSTIDRQFVEDPMKRQRVAGSTRTEPAQVRIDIHPAPKSTGPRSKRERVMKIDW